MTTAAPAPAPAAAPAAPAPAPAAPAPAAPTPSPAPAASPAAPASLFTAAPAAAPAPAEAAPAASGDLPAWLPEKYRVVGTDGKLDLAASSQKLAEGYAAAAKRIGTGDLPPETPEAYQFTPPEAFKDVPLDAELSRSFRERAHKAGLTQSQFDFVMGEYFEMVPSVLNGAAKVSAEQARGELQKVWKSTAEFEAGMSAAQRAINSAPADLQSKLVERYGTDPVFAQFAALFGREMQEDRAPSAPAASGDAAGAESLMASEAYRNPKHPDHARVSGQVKAHFERRYGTAPVNG